MEQLSKSGLENYKCISLEVSYTWKNLTAISCGRGLGLTEAVVLDTDDNYDDDDDYVRDYVCT